MPRIILPPDAFDDYPEERGWTSDPDDGDPGPLPADFAEQAARLAAERRYDDGERFAGLFADAERAGAA